MIKKFENKMTQEEKAKKYDELKEYIDSYLEDEEAEIDLCMLGEMIASQFGHWV